MRRFFVYGTLKRGGSNHHVLAGARFLGVARTAPGWRLFALDGYPGMVPWPADGQGVVGEVWEAETEVLARLDAFEGVHEGLYRRQPVPLAHAPAGVAGPVDAYVYAGDVSRRREIGAEWRE